MDNAHIASLTARLDRIERENRRLKRVGAGALAGLGFLTLMSMAAPVCKTIWAERFVLQDASDRARLTLNAYGTDQPGITFHDGRGQAVASIALAADGALAAQVIEKGKSHPARFALAKDGSLQLERAARPETGEMPDAEPAGDRRRDGVGAPE